jgi:methionyl-tRNA formyltransferase
MILYLGPSSPLVQFLGEKDEVLQCSEPLERLDLEQLRPEWAVSYGYRHIIRQPELERFHDRIINLHISLLPWNRGADPNLWSWIDDTPKGVTIHYVDAGIDTGDIIAQRQMTFSGDETLAETYDGLHRAMRGLFRDQWPAISSGHADRRPQAPGGSYHRVADRVRVVHLLVAGWDTPVRNLSH